MAPPVPQPPQFLRRWRHLVSKLIYMLWSANQGRIHEQILDLKRGKKEKRLPEPNENQAGCLHPLSVRLKRANKWAVWTMCGKCQLRLTYQETEAKKKHQAEKIEKAASKKKEPAGCSPEAHSSASSTAPPPKASQRKPPEDQTANSEVLERMARLMASSLEATAERLGEVMNQSLAPIRQALEAQSAQAALHAQNLATLTAVLAPVSDGMDEEVWGEEANWTLEAPSTRA